MAIRFNSKTGKIESYDDDEEDGVDFSVEESDTSSGGMQEDPEGFLSFGFDESGQLTSKNQKDYFDKDWQQKEEERKRLQEDEQRKQEEAKKLEEDRIKAAESGYTSVDQYRDDEKRRQGNPLERIQQGLSDFGYQAKQFLGIEKQKAETTLETRKVLEGDAFEKNNLLVDKDLQSIEQQIENYKNGGFILKQQENLIKKEGLQQKDKPDWGITGDGEIQKTKYKYKDDYLLSSNGQYVKNETPKEHEILFDKNTNTYFYEDNGVRENLTIDPSNFRFENKDSDVVNFVAGKIDTKGMNKDALQTLLAGGEEGSQKKYGDFGQLYANEIDKLNAVADLYKQYLGKMDVNRDVFTGFSRQFNQLNLENKIPLFGQILELEDNYKLPTLVDKYNKGEPLNAEEYGIVAEARAKNIESRINLGYGDQVGGMLAHMPTFIAEFAMTGGIQNLGKAGVTKLIGESLTKKSAETFVKGMARTAIGELARTSIGFAPHIANKTAEYMLPRWDLTEGEKGEVLINELEKGDKFEDAFVKAGLSTYVENLSESAGLLVDEATPFLKKAILGKFLQKYAKESGEELTEEASKNLVMNFLKEKGGWNGILGEVFEEEIAEPAQAAIEGREYKDPITTPEGRERLLVEVLGISAFQGVASVPDLAFKTTKKIREHQKKVGVNDSMELNVDQTDKESKPNIATDPMQNIEPGTDVSNIINQQEFNVKQFLEDFNVEDEGTKGVDERSNNKFNAALEYISQNIPKEQQIQKINDLRKELNVDDPVAQQLAKTIDSIYLKNYGDITKEPAQAELKNLVKEGLAKTETKPELGITIEKLPPELKKLVQSSQKNKVTLEKFNKVIENLKTTEDTRLQKKYSQIEQELQETNLNLDDLYKLSTGESLPVRRSTPGTVTNDGGRIQDFKLLATEAQNYSNANDFSKALDSMSSSKLKKLGLSKDRSGNVELPEGIKNISELYSNAKSNLNINQKQNESNQENEAIQDSQQDQKEETGNGGQTIWETAVAQKESIKDQLNEEEISLLEVFETAIENESITKFSERAFEVLSELESAQAGFRYATQTVDSMDLQFRGQKSTFPDWFSLRTRSEIDNFLTKIPEDINLWNKENNPYKEGTKNYTAWNEFIDQIGTTQDYKNDAINSLESDSGFQKDVQDFLGTSLTEFKNKVSGLVQQKQSEQNISDNVQTQLDQMQQSTTDAINQTTQAVEAINETIKQLTPTQQKTVNQTPVQQESGKVKNSKYYQRALTEYNENLGDLVTYDQINLKEDLARAVNFMTENYNQAKDIALGKDVKIPAGITQAAISLAVRSKAKEDGDLELYNMIYSNISRRATRAGQELVALRGTHSSDSLAQMIDTVTDRRIENLFKENEIMKQMKKLMGNENKSPKDLYRERVKKEAKEISKVLSKDTIKIQKAQEIIDLLTC